MASVAEALRAALDHHEAGRIAEAEILYRRILEADPASADAHALIGLLLAQDARFEAALDHLDRALSLDPARSDAAMNRAKVLLALGRRDAALDAFRAVLSPDRPEAARHLAELLAARGLERLQQGQWADGVADLLDLLATAPADAPRVAPVVGQLIRAGQPDAALRLLTGLAAAAAGGGAGVDLPALWRDLSLAFQRERNPWQAIQCLDRVAALLPRDLSARAQKAALARAAGNDALAAAAHRELVEIEPGQPLHMANLALSLHAAWRPEEALPWMERALALEPDRVDWLQSRAHILRDCGRGTEAVEAYRRALRLRPDRADIHTALIFALDQDPELPAQEHAAERRRWFAAHGQALVPASPVFAGSRDPERRLRVGYVSGDFRNHSAAYCIAAPILNHDPESVEVCLYSNVVRPDPMTDRFRARADLWVDAAGLDDAALAARIRADGIDILVDLGGHTASSRLPVFCRRPAPVQVSAWGHVTGTGIPVMDALFADPVLVPAEIRPTLVERVVDLPCAIALVPPPDAPMLVALPAARAGRITFGCLNRLGKVTDDSLRLWARVLDRVPDARLLLKDFVLDDAGVRRSFQDRAAACGIDPARLELRGASLRAEHLATYGLVDIALDPLLYSGGVTTLESLWMGCPVVTLPGLNLASRASACVLAALDRAELIAADADFYVEIAAALARDPGRLSALRAGLRPAMAASPVGNPLLYARAVEAAYRDLWRRWCASAAQQGL